ncbi:MAG TPA: hypothetical protein VGB55_09315 [Tepidisphaeraceae bacterium]
MDKTLVFAPRESNYELHLQTLEGYEGVINQPIDVVVRASARKIYTVPSGGLFVSPIRGTPRIVQGRVKAFDQRSLTLQCGVLVTVDLPTGDGAIDLAEGQIEVGSLVNVVLLPGARAEIAA